MTEQLTFFGTWEPVVPDVPMAAEIVAPPPPGPMDARQAWLFDGPHSLRQEAEQACEELNATGVRLSLRKARERYPAWPGAHSWEDWAAGIDHLVDAEELTARALALDDVQGARLFPGMSAGLLQRVRSAALCRAAEQLLLEQGTAACLPDGRAVGYLYLVAGAPAQAAVRLREHLPLCASSGRGMLLGYLGEALWRCDQPREALAAYRDAYLAGPGGVDEKIMTCAPIMDLLDSCADLPGSGDGREWLPVLGDLLAVVPLSEDCVPAPPDAGTARAAAALLAEYRQRQAAGMDDAERITRKRQLLRVAPCLKEHLRRL